MVFVRLCPAVAAAALTLALAFPASASLLITIDKASQRMIVALDDLPVFDWPVSTGQNGYDTPVGEYKPFRMEKTHFSREWDDAPMPNSIFFTELGHAIHGSFDVKRLGTPASHGCVRLSPQNAATLFALVKQEKMANTRVVLTGDIPAAPVPNVVKRTPRLDDEDFTSALPPRSAKRADRADRGWREWREFRDSRGLDSPSWFDRGTRRFEDDRRAPEIGRGSNYGLRNRETYSNDRGWRDGQPRYFRNNLPFQ